jgi:uncharacterized RDD family membrane protein YckC
VIDGLILFLIGLAVTVAVGGIWSLHFEWAAAASVGFGLGFYAYKVVTQAVWGKTIGKRVLGIRLRMKDGAPARSSAVLIRYLPGFAYGGAYAAGWVLMVHSAGWATLQDLPPAERAQLMAATAPVWWRLLRWVMLLWLLVNAIVLRNSSNHRALHDLIAGTKVQDDG